MKTSVYIESSVISYLTARPSNFTIFVSTLVEEEISRGNPEAAQRRLEVSEKIPNLSISSDAKEIAEVLISTGAVPSNSEEDALHIGIATAHGMHFLLTWNFKHINNAETKSVINKTIEDLGYIAPILCSPEELGASS